jgi:hypothetical protein
MNKIWSFVLNRRLQKVFCLFCLVVFSMTARAATATRQEVVTTTESNSPAKPGKILKMPAPRFTPTPTPRKTPPPPDVRPENKSSDRKLTQETDRATVTQLPSAGKRWALVIGVDNYKDPQISGLRGAANDAKSLARALETHAGFPSDQIVLLATDQPEERQPTRVNILRRLSNLLSLVPKDGLLLISFAGHGMERGGQAFLLPSDAQISDDINFLEDTAVNAARMRDRVKTAGIGQVLILLDACRNDPGGRAEEANNMTRNFAQSFNFDVKNREVTAFATLYATAVGQRAYEYSEKKQGYFTWAVVEAMKGAAANDRGEVTLAGLLRFVQESVPKRVAIDLGAGKNQKPFAVVEGYRAEDLIIAVGGAKSVQNDVSPPTNQVTPPQNKEKPASKDSSESSIKLVSKPGDLPLRTSGSREVTGFLDRQLSTQTARVGDRFTLRMTSPLEYQGAIIEGRVAKVQPAGRGNKGAKIGLAFDRLRYKDGRTERFSGMIMDTNLSSRTGFSISYEEDDAAGTTGGEKGTVILFAADSGNMTITAGAEFTIEPDGSAAKLTAPITPAPQPQGNDSSGLSGAWGLTLNTPGQPGFMILTLAREGERLTGTIADYLTQHKTSEIQNGKITGDGFRFAAPMITGSGRSVTVVFEGRINGTRLSGTITTPQGPIQFSAVRADQ